MKVELIVVGKTVKTYLKEGEEEYMKRLKHYVSFQEVVISDLKGVGKMSEDEIKKKEGELILNKISESDEVILLDENGKLMSSVEMSDYIQKKMNSGIKKLIFVVGGAYGFSSDVYARCNGKLSLSKMTFSHQMIRMIFKEQLYRSFTILNNEPYHHR